MPDDRFGRPKFVREREIFYDDVPDMAPSCQPDYDDSPLGDPVPPSKDHGNDDEE